MKRLADFSLLALFSAGLLACGLQDVQYSGREQAAGEGHRDEVVAAQPDSNVICRNVKATGTHMIRRVCLTQAEKEALEESSKDWLRTRGASGGPTRVLGPDDPRRND